MFDAEIELARTRISAVIHDPTCPEESKVLLRIVFKNLNRVRDVADDIRPEVKQALAEPYLDRCAALLDVVTESLSDQPNMYHCVHDVLESVFSMYSQGIICA